VERARTERAEAEPDSPLPPDPAGGEDVMSDEPGPAGRTARAVGENSPLSPDPARPEDAIGDGD
jgi:hypothetical protein